MISYETIKGNICFSNEYLAKLIGNAIGNCYGDVGMVPNIKQKLSMLLTKSNVIDKGIQVRGNIDTVTVDLHIAVIYGININTIANSITEAVKYTVKKATGISVSKVTVKVDEIVTE